MGLTAEQKAFFDENGYIVIKGLLSRDEAAACRAECHDLAARLAKIRDINATWASVKDMDVNGKRPVLQHCHDVQYHSAALARLMLDPRLTSVAAGIIGPNVQLHHTKMFIKPPEKGSPFPMHQDYPYFPHKNHTMMAVIVHFDDAPIAKGCLRVVPGSHKRGPIPTTRSDFSLPPDEFPIENALPLEAEAGDAVYFNYLTIHGSGVNVSGEARTTLLIQMRDPLDPPTRKTHESRGQGLMLAGIDPSCSTVPVCEEKKAESALGVV